MQKLSATFGVEFIKCIYARMETETVFYFEMHLEDSSIEISFRPKLKGQTISREPENGVLFCVSEIEIKVTKEVPDDVNPYLFDIKVNNTTNNLSKRLRDFEDLEAQYKRIAHLVFERLFGFFRYSLGAPLLGQLSDYDREFLNPMWENEEGKVLNPLIRTHRIENDFIRHVEELGVRAITDQMEPEIRAAIENDQPAELYQEILHNAKSAIFEKNYRRAVLEMAMACELAIKRTYFSKSTVAGRAYEFMEDRQKISLNITDYIDGVAEYALGEKFKDASTKTDFLNIQHLFGGRNKIAHRGELFFRDDKGKNHPIDLAVLKRWWKSVELLLAWLNSKRSA